MLMLNTIVKAIIWTLLAPGCFLLKLLGFGKSGGGIPMGLLLGIFGFILTMAIYGCIVGAIVLVVL